MNRKTLTRVLLGTVLFGLGFGGCLGPVERNEFVRDTEFVRDRNTFVLGDPFVRCVSGICNFGK